MTNIEELQLNCKEYDDAALFALPNLVNLRVLRMYALGEPYAVDYEIPLNVLANNPAAWAILRICNCITFQS